MLRIVVEREWKGQEEVKEKKDKNKAQMTASRFLRLHHRSMGATNWCELTFLLVSTATSFASWRYVTVYHPAVSEAEQVTRVKNPLDFQSHHPSLSFCSSSFFLFIINLSPCQINEIIENEQYKPHFPNEHYTRPIVSERAAKYIRKSMTTSTLMP